MAAEERSMPFIRNLASSDRKIRTAALSSLRNFLSARQQHRRPGPGPGSGGDVPPLLTPLDQLKLWKGLFYALWMCDRAVPQQALCRDLADLPLSAAWLRAFWATMAREWGGIDGYRLDKFMLLVRRMLGASLAWMRAGADQHGGEGRKNWDAERVAVVLGLLREWPLALADEAVVFSEHEPEQQAESDRGGPKGGEGSLLPQMLPVGLRLHVLDIWVDEAGRAGLLKDDDEEARAIVLRIVDMVDALERETKSAAVRVRTKDSLADERLPGNRRQRGRGEVKGSGARKDDAEMVDVGDDGSWDGFDD